MAVMPLAFIGGTEIFWIILLGLMLFGGKLPEVAKDLGKMFFKARRSINEIRRESGIEDAIRDLERESAEVTRSATDVGSQIQKAASIPDWRQAVDHGAGPGAAEPEVDARLETDAQAEPEAEPEPKTEPDSKLESGENSTSEPKKTDSEA